MFQANLSTVIPTSLKLHFLKIDMFSVENWTGSDCLGTDPTWVPSSGKPRHRSAGTGRTHPSTLFGSGPCEKGGKQSQEP